MTEHRGLSPSLTMWNGVHIPMVGLGTWEANPPEKLKEALRCAFDAGYRLIDTAYFYGNEHIIGEVIEEYTTQRKLTRAELFITTKVRVLLRDSRIRGKLGRLLELTNNSKIYSFINFWR